MFTWIFSQPAWIPLSQMLSTLSMETKCHYRISKAYSEVHFIQRKQTKHFLKGFLKSAFESTFQMQSRSWSCLDSSIWLYRTEQDKLQQDQERGSCSKPEFSTIRRRMRSIYYIATFSIMIFGGSFQREGNKPRTARKVKFSSQHKNLTNELG